MRAEEFNIDDKVIVDNRNAAIVAQLERINGIINLKQLVKEAIMKGSSYGNNKLHKEVFFMSILKEHIYSVHFSK
jgi:hypothetical protein